MTHDRLPDSMLLDKEVIEHDEKVLEYNRYSKEDPIKKCICAYPMYVDGSDTKIVVIVNTDNMDIMHKALCRDWSDTKATIALPHMGELEWSNDEKLNALYVVLEKYRFHSNKKTKTSDRLYKWKNWMINLL